MLEVSTIGVHETLQKLGDFNWNIPKIKGGHSEKGLVHLKTCINRHAAKTI